MSTISGTVSVVFWMCMCLGGKLMSHEAHTPELETVVEVLFLPAGDPGVPDLGWFHILAYNYAYLPGFVISQ